MQKHHIAMIRLNHDYMVSMGEPRNQHAGIALRIDQQEVVYARAMVCFGNANPMIGQFKQGDYLYSCFAGQGLSEY